MFFLCEETIAVILQVGEFTFENTQVTASLLKIYVCGILFSSSLTVITRYYNANKRYKLYLYLNSLLTLLDISATIILIKLVYSTSAIPLGFITSYLIVLVIYLCITKLNYLKIAKNLLKLLAVNIPLLLLFILYSNNKELWYSNGSTLINLFKTCLLYLGAIILTLIVYYIFKVDFIFKKKLLNK